MRIICVCIYVSHKYRRMRATKSKRTIADIRYESKTNQISTPSDQHTRVSHKFPLTRVPCTRTDMRVVVLTPAGRRRYMEKLVIHLEKQKDSFSEWHLWNNTRNSEDEKYIRDLGFQYDWIRVVERELGDSRGTNYAIHKFFDYTTDPNTVYIRLDDDIIWLDDGFIQNMKEFRLAHPEYFLVTANVVNNNIIASIQQRNGRVLRTQGTELIDYNCLGNLWRKPELALQIHTEFARSKKLDTVKKDWTVQNWVFWGYERFSINAICWIGGSFDDFGKIVDKEDEQWLSVDHPKKLGIPNILNGSAICQHFAFYMQREGSIDGKSLDDRLDELSQ